MRSTSGRRNREPIPDERRERLVELPLRLCGNGVEHQRGLARAETPVNAVMARRGTVSVTFLRLF